MHNDRDKGLETLLDLDGVVINQEKGYWVKFEVSKTDITKERPHGLSYSLTLHEKYGKRVIGYDNAHAVKLPKKYKYSGRIIEYDHHHRHSLDSGIPYEFKNPYQLLQDFFEKVDEIIKRAGRVKMNTNETTRIGIMPQEKIRERMLNIAKGSYKPEPNEPKIWFTSMRSLAEVLSDENRALLHVIRETKPNSIKELSDTTGRKPSNLSRTLKTLSNYGIVELIKESKQVKPIVNTVKFEILAA